MIQTNHLFRILNQSHLDRKTILFCHSAASQFLYQISNKLENKMQLENGLENSLVYIRDLPRVISSAQSQLH